MNIQKLKISDLKPAPYNPRKSTKEQEQKLKESLEKFGVVEPIIFNERSGYIVGGHFRVRELKKLGYTEIDCVIVNLSEEDEKELNIRLNANTGEWDNELLKNWDIDLLNEWGLNLPEYKNELILEAKEDNFEIPEIVHTDIVLGDLFEIGEHKLLCGDSCEIDTWRKLMGEKLCDLVITDPPYNVSYQGGTKDKLTILNDSKSNEDFYNFLYDAFVALYSFTKPGGSWYVWHADSEGYNFRKAFIDSGILLKQCIIWVKNTMVLGRQDYQWKHEPCLYGWKPGASHYFTSERHHTTVMDDTINISKLSKSEIQKILNDLIKDKINTTVIYCDKPTKNDVHPTMKPILLISKIMQNSSKINNIVCDAFLGSGSTMVAAHQLSRICYGMELDPKYCQVIIDRMRKLDSNLIIKKNGKVINYE